MGLMIRIGTLPDGQELSKLELDEAVTTIEDVGGIDTISGVRIPDSITLPPIFFVLCGKSRLIKGFDYHIDGNTLSFPNGLSRKSQLSIVDLATENAVWVWHPVSGQAFP